LDSTSAKYKLLKEGTVIKTEIYGEDVLYQIIDGRTYKEKLEEHNIYGYLTGMAQKLDKDNKDNKILEVVKWLSNIYSPVFFDETESVKNDNLAVEKLPETGVIWSPYMDSLLSIKRCVKAVSTIIGEQWKVLKGKRYSEAFKKSAVLRVVDQKMFSHKVSKEWGISQPRLSKWIKKYKKEGSFSTSSERAEIKRLQAKVKRLKTERDILKKAAIFFADHEE